MRPRHFYRDPGGSWGGLTALKGLTQHSDPMGFVSQTRTLEVVEPLEKGFGLFAVNHRAHLVNEGLCGLDARREDRGLPWAVVPLLAFAPGSEQ